MVSVASIGSADKFHREEKKVEGCHKGRIKGVQYIPILTSIVCIVDANVRAVYKSDRPLGGQY